MERITSRQIVLVRFPFSDLSSSKLRPALALTCVEYGDVLLCQITSKNYGDRNAIEISEQAFDRSLIAAEFKVS